MTKFRKTSEIRLNPANPRIIRDEKYRVLVRSVAQFPKMLDKRGIVVDGSKMILGGNQRWRAILDILKMPESELTALLNGDTETFARWEILREKQAVPENWIVDGSDMTDDEIRRFIIADNVEMGEHDWDMLANQWDADELSDWGVDVPGFDGEGGKPEEDIYSKKIEAPIYEPKNEKPDHVDLFDTERQKSLIEDIGRADILDADKEFLKLAASRHVVFNYERIADFYAHSAPEVQRLMEDSALVIIDFDRAIELGYARISDEIAELYAQEYPADND